jgi:hypothetical protein
MPMAWSAGMPVGVPLSPPIRYYDLSVNPIGLVFLPAGIALMYYGTPAITNRSVRRKRVEDEKRRDLITRGGTRLGEPSEAREAWFAWMALGLGVAFAVAGLSALF